MISINTEGDGSNTVLEIVSADGFENNDFEGYERVLIPSGVEVVVESPFQIPENLEVRGDLVVKDYE